MDDWVKNIADALKGQWEQGRPYRDAAVGLFQGNSQPARQLLNQKSKVTPMTQEQALALALDWSNPIAGIGGIVKNKALEKAAREHFGTTRNMAETGYILDDATRLDLSGRHYASGYEKTPTGYKPKAGQPDYLRGGRSVDHREVGDLIDAGGGWENLSSFMDETGAVRYMPDTGISLVDTNMPSKAQIDAVVADFKRSGNPLIIDIDKKANGANIASKEFEKLNSDEIYKWIQGFYK